MPSRANNGALMTPTLIMTRPTAQSECFAAELLARWKGPLKIIYAPLIEIVMQGSTFDDPDAVIFTSANGVAASAQFDLTKGLPAWCVGKRTAEVAQRAGFAVIEGPGTADGLVARIIDAKPLGSVAHIRGMHARGDISARLNAVGVPCVDVVAYDQREIPLSTQALTALAGVDPVIFPLFSPRTAAILNKQGPFAAPVAVVAMSKAVQDMLDPTDAERAAVAEKPDAASMIEATLVVIERLVARA